MGAKMQREKKSKTSEPKQNHIKSPEIRKPRMADELKAEVDMDEHYQGISNAMSGVSMKDISRPSSSGNELAIQQFSQDLNSSRDSMSNVPAPLDASKHPYVFRWEGNGSKVYVSGSYDNWTTRTPLTRSKTQQFTVIDIPLGIHQYKFFVDGEWRCDPNVMIVNSECGTKNNVLTYEKSDYNVLEALQADDYDDDVVPGRWSQYIPPLCTSGTGYLRKGPPALPPYIGNSLLNLELSSQGDPNLLPEPRQVSLNHLYTSSIKDGVAILSVTTRYRRKYITTVLYQPFTSL